LRSFGLCLLFLLQLLRLGRQLVKLARQFRFTLRLQSGTPPLFKYGVFLVRLAIRFFARNPPDVGQHLAVLILALVAAVVR
jgi:hypothetical protein